MRLLITLFFTLMLLQGFAQKQVSPEYVEADEAQTLAAKLTGYCKTDHEKVEAIFRWITSHISYQVRPWYNRSYQSRGSKKYEVEDPSDTASILKPLDERVADLVIRRGQAYCDGYARLFKTLCDYSNVTAVVITGYSRIGMDRLGKKFKSNHTWNAVKLDSTWHLLDVTWASGFVTYSGNEFIRQFDTYYYLTPPERFIADHYPEDLQWTLLQKPPTLTEFKLAPFKQQGFVRSQITSFKPEKGLLEATLGDTLWFELETNSTETAKTSKTPPTDDDSGIAFLQEGKQWTYVKPLIVLPGKLLYAFAVIDPLVEYVNLVFNDYVLMRYRLNISKPVFIQNSSTSFNQ